MFHYRKHSFQSNLKEFWKVTDGMLLSIKHPLRWKYMTFSRMIQNTTFLLLTAMLFDYSCWLMVCTYPLFSFLFFSGKWKISAWPHRKPGPCAARSDAVAPTAATARRPGGHHAATQPVRPTAAGWRRRARNGRTRARRRRRQRVQQGTSITTGRLPEGVRHQFGDLPPDRSGGERSRPQHGGGTGGEWDFESYQVITVEL